METLVAGEGEAPAQIPGSQEVTGPVGSYRLIHGWTDRGPYHRQMDGVVEWMERWVDGWKEDFLHIQMHGWLAGWIDRGPYHRQMDRAKDGWMQTGPSPHTDGRDEFLTDRPKALRTDRSIHPAPFHPLPSTSSCQLTFPEDAEAELSGPCGAAQRAGTMEQLQALSPVLCIVLLIPTWTAAVAEIPVGCKREPNPNVGASGQKPDGLRVSQEPKSLNATAGENVTLSCTFQNTNGSRAKVLWFRGSGEDVVLDANHPFYQGRLHVSRLDEIKKGNATLTLSKLDKRDSGLYQCCIEIHKTTGMGGGTNLTVMRRNQSVTEDRKESKQDTSTELTLYRATIALAGVSIIILVTALLLRRRTASPDTQQQQPAKGHSRAGGNASKDLHYAEITFKAPAHTEYASVRTQRL
ncbi:uncharacterized protein LOC120392440 isoform X2 [Mauremys reevesii]|uniref:uncharacterized protein LOC120392440 isoform X2 n=1 Tax=Mauremys reevesii TaxID=260615 RepID=UPI00193F03E8|nr:uncharacterized protein LOC120392440 isoform X2 [Mauremys reevesii]